MTAPGALGDDERALIRTAKALDPIPTGPTLDAAEDELARLFEGFLAARVGAGETGLRARIEATAELVDSWGAVVDAWEAVSAQDPPMPIRLRVQLIDLMEKLSLTVAALDATPAQTEAVALVEAALDAESVDAAADCRPHGAARCQCGGQSDV